MKITTKTLLLISLFTVTAPLYTATADTVNTSWWDKISAELRHEGSVFKAGQHLEPSSVATAKVASTAPITAIIKRIENAGHDAQRRFYTWFGSQQDLVANRFKGKPESYIYDAGDNTYTFNVDIPASQKAWATLSDAKKLVHDGSPTLMITVTTKNNSTHKQETFAPVLIGKSRKNGYSVENTK